MFSRAEHFEVHWEACVCWERSHFYLQQWTNSLSHSSDPAFLRLFIRQYTVRMLVWACQGGQNGGVLFILAHLFFVLLHHYRVHSGWPSVPDTTLIMAFLDTQRIESLSCDYTTNAPVPNKFLEDISYSIYHFSRVVLWAENKGYREGFWCLPYIPRVRSTLIKKMSWRSNVRVLPS